MDTAHRKFGLIGLAAVGPIANSLVPDLKAIIGSKEDHELWSAAIASLRAIGSDAKELGPDLKRTLTSPDERQSGREHDVLQLHGSSLGHYRRAAFCGLGAPSGPLSQSWALEMFGIPH